MLWTIFVVLLILWLLGFSLHIAGGLIHLLLVSGASGSRYQPVEWTFQSVSLQLPACVSD